MTAGATEAIAAALLALCEPGDEVVVFEPYYDSYAACVAMAGARRRAVTLRHAGLTRSTSTQLRARDHPAHQADPAQHAAQPDRQGVRPRRAAGHRRPRPSSTTCIVVTDEVYEHLVFDGRRTSRSPTLPGMRERTVTIWSGGKTFIVHRLEDRLGLRAARAHRGRSHREAVPHLRQRRHRSNPRSRSASTCPTTTSSELAADLHEQARPAVRRARPTLGFEVHPAAGHLLRRPSTSVARRDDGLAFCRPLPGSTAWSRSRAACSTTTRRRSARLVRFAFCKRPRCSARRCTRLKELADEGRRRPARHRLGGRRTRTSRDVAPLIARRRPRGARLIVLTEMFATGFSMQPERIAEPAGGADEHSSSTRPRAHGVWLVRLRARAGRRRRPARNARAGRARRRRAALRQDPPVQLRRRARALRRGRRRSSPSTSTALRCQPFVCYDLRFADEFWASRRPTDLTSCRELARATPRALAGAAAGARHREPGLRLGVNRVGAAKNERYVGDSAIVDPLGLVLVEASMGETVLVADVTAERVADVRKRLPFLADRRP